MVAEGLAVAAFDVQAPLLSLLELCGTTTESVPAAVPYLAAEPEQWRCGVGRSRITRAFQVGLCWRGSRMKHGDRQRSISLRRFALSAAAEGVRRGDMRLGTGATGGRARGPV